MPSLIVEKRATGDVEDITHWISHDNVDAAIRFASAVRKAFELISAHPGIGPEWEPRLRDYPDLRFWPITGFRNYLVLYQVGEETVRVLRIVHGARDVTRVMGPPL